jgi:hypothetical protein
MSQITPKNLYAKPLPFLFMRQLSLTDTQELVSSFVKSFGQSGAAKKLTEIGYTSPTGGQIVQAHVYRILHGSGTCLLAPEENQQPPTTKEPIATVPKRAKQIAEELFEDEKLLRHEITKVSEELRQELIEEEAALQELERSLPPLVPCTASRPHRERSHIERDVRVSGIFSPRSPIELDEDRSFFGIPCMKHPQPVTMSRPYQPRRYGQNVLSSRDLSIYQK